MKTLQPRVQTLRTGVAAPAKRAMPFYLSGAWRDLISTLIHIRGRACEQCGATGQRLYGDHITELSDGGAELDPANVMLLCGACHQRKTARRAQVRMGVRF